MGTVIETSGLGKRYHISHEAKNQWSSLREALSNAARGLVKSAMGRAPQTGEDFWALKDVDFSVSAGERVGIIGRNGAGKSTLLKLLARVAEPSAGRITLRGRVASLLEVGTGFHPELSGRENIYLNGAILGMSRAEIRAKFDAIVAFAEVERFLDTPVKRYSSGMYMRLAFAVAAHLEPEILIVDEVLAVGDVEFQRKCLGRMKEIGGEGRTVIFVSHNMSAVRALCGRCLFLRKGRLERDSGDIESVIRGYMGGDEAPLEWIAGDIRLPNREFMPRRLRLRGGDGATLRGSLRAGDEAFVEVEADIETQDSALSVGYALFNEEGHQVYWSYHTDQPEESWPRLRAGRVTLSSPLPPWLNEGRYRLELTANLHARRWLYEPGASPAAITFEVEGQPGEQMLWRTRRPTQVAPVLPWVLAEDGR